MDKKTDPEVVEKLPYWRREIRRIYEEEKASIMEEMKTDRDDK